MGADDRRESFNRCKKLSINLVICDTCSFPIDDPGRVPGGVLKPIRGMTEADTPLKVRPEELSCACVDPALLVLILVLLTQRDAVNSAGLRFLERYTRDAGQIERETVSETGSGRG
jgi:hypothetical protein